MEQARAGQACSACKRLKRACDKKLPKCRLCSRTGRRCEYNVASEEAPSIADFQALQARLVMLEDRLGVNVSASDQPSTTSGHDDHGTFHNGQSKAAVSEKHISSAALFLDIDCFLAANMRLPSPDIKIPMETLALLTQGNTVVDTCEEYFATIHNWWPIVSKKRFDLGIAVLHTGPDLAMLFLAMRLITSVPVESGIDPLYDAAKQFMATLHDAGFISTCCLQAMLLLALYEYSHAIYPAAWMTVGACARYVELLGLSSTTPTCNWAKPCITWTEIEERRRLCWGVFVLDRVICLGSRRPPCLAAVKDDYILPVSDQYWDAGQVSRIEVRSTKTATDDTVSPFAQLCRAATLTDRAIASARQTCPSYQDTIMQFDLSQQLWELMLSCDTAAETDPTKALHWLGPRCVIRSLIFVALDLLTCPEKIHKSLPAVSEIPKSTEELALQKRAISMIHEVTEHCYSMALGLVVTFDDQHDQHDQAERVAQVSPLALDAMYCSLATCEWLAGEHGVDQYQAKISTFRNIFQITGQRWRSSRTYLQLAGFYDVVIRSQILS